MHSSLIHTACLLTVSQHALGGVCPDGVSAWGVFAWGGLPGGCVSPCNGAENPPSPWTDTCENITFANFANLKENRLVLWCHVRSISNWPCPTCSWRWKPFWSQNMTSLSYFRFIQFHSRSVLLATFQIKWERQPYFNLSQPFYHSVRLKSDTHTQGGFNSRYWLHCQWLYLSSWIFKGF